MSDAMEQVRAVLGARWEGTSLKAKCPVHNSEHLYVQPPNGDDLPTFVCRKEADWSVLRPALREAGVPEALLRGAPATSEPGEELPDEARLARWVDQLAGWATPDFSAYLQHEVGLSPERARAEGLGARTNEGRDPRITIPVRDVDGALVGVRLWNPFLPKESGRQKTWVPGHKGTQHLLGAHRLRDLAPEESVLLVEGEPDYLAARAAGVPVVAVTAGASSVPEHVGALSGRRVVVCFDNDEPGRTGARKQAAALVEVGAQVWRADISAHVPEPGGDLRDWLIGGGGSPERLRHWMAATTEQLPLLADELDAAGEHHRERVQSRYDVLRADREAKRMVALDEAAGLFSGFDEGTLGDLLAEEREPTPWIIENLLRAGHKAVLTAAFKVGKTTLLTNVVRALVDGELLFDRFPAPGFSGSVVVFDYELTRDDAADLYERVGVLNPGDVRLQSLRGTGFSLANDFHAEQTVDYLRSSGASVWVIDPYARAMRGFGSENSNDDVGNFLACVDKIASEAGLLGVVISAHTGRAEQSVGNEHARGATKIDDDPDARWVYTRDDTGTRFFRAEGRNQVGCDEFAMRFNPDTERLTGSHMSRYESKNQEKAKAAVRIVLGAGESGIKATDLQARMAGSDEKPKRAAISFAVSQGWLTADARGGRGGTWYTTGPTPPDDLNSLREA